jgi:hypothetical protein
MCAWPRALRRIEEHLTMPLWTLIFPLQVVHVRNGNLAKVVCPTLNVAQIKGLT